MKKYKAGARTGICWSFCSRTMSPTTIWLQYFSTRQPWCRTTDRRSLICLSVLCRCFS